MKSSLEDVLEIDLVRNNLFGFLQPLDLINCRLVSIGLYKKSNCHLGKEGWSIHLRNAPRCEEYLAVTRKRKTIATLDPWMGIKSTWLPLSVYVNLDNHKEVKNAKDICKEFPVKSLECIVSAESAESGLTGQNILDLITSCATEIYHMSIILVDSDQDQVYNFDWPQEFQLPNLLSFSSEYRGQEEYVGTFLAQICHLTSMAPNLRRVSGLRGMRAPRNQDSGVGVLREIALGECSEQLRNLVEIEVYVARLDSLWTSPVLNDVEYTSLAKLIIHTPDDFGRTPNLAQDVMGNPRPSTLLQFVQLRCPNLTSLELINTYVDPVGVLPIPLLTNRAAGVLLHPPLPDITHFGFQYEVRHACEFPYKWNSGVSAVGRMGEILWTMNRLTGLTSITTNWEACMALVMFDRDSPRALQESTWLLVETITINIAHCSIHEALNVVDVFKIRELLNKMFPCLENLVINLGADRVVWKATTDLGILLGFVCQFRHISSVVFNNYYNAWKWTQPILEREEDQPFDQEAICYLNTNLKRFAINAIRRTFANQHVDPATYSPQACIDLYKVVDLIPKATRMGLQEFRVDTKLLVKPYNELLAQVRTIEMPPIWLL